MSDQARMTLPPLALCDLPEPTKDYLLALCHQQRLTPEQALKRVLDASAASAGFLPMPNAAVPAANEPQPEVAA